MSRGPMTEEQKEARRVKRAEEERQRQEEIALRAAEYELMSARARKLEALKWIVRDLRVENRALLEAPVWESHRRAKNWAATVEIEPTLPGGLKRSWWKRGRGVAYYVVPEDLKPGDIVEFGADYYTSMSRQYANRVYAVVIVVTSSLVRIKPCKTMEEAMRERDDLEGERRGEG